MQTETFLSLPHRLRRRLAGFGPPLILIALVAGMGLATRPADAAIEVLATQTSTTCGSVQHVTVVVTTAAGAPVADNTAITFTTTLGYISSPVATRGGTAVAQFVVPSRVSGSAMVAVSGAGFNASKAISITCPTPPAPQFVQRPAIPMAVTSAPAPPTVPVAPAPPPAAAPAPAMLTVSAFDFGYNPRALSVRAGQNVTINTVNTGRLPHTFTIAGVVDSGSIAAGASRAVQFNTGAPRTVTFFCTIHGANAMSGTLTVTP